jgi:hypothetical protein
MVQGHPVVGYKGLMGTNSTGWGVGNQGLKRGSFMRQLWL